MATLPSEYEVIVIGGGHAGAEAAWAAANLGARVALITMDRSKIGAMSCNPAIGGLAKGQMVREIDALGGLMALAADATGIQFRMLNLSKGPAVRGPRCQSDKYRYAREVQRLLATRPNIDILEGSAEEFIIEDGRCVGVVMKTVRRVVDDATWMDAVHRGAGSCCAVEFKPQEEQTGTRELRCKAAVLTTGTFMRGLMHTGERKTEGGRVGEGAAVGISGTLRNLGFDLGRLKTGTPPRLAAESIDFDTLELQPGDDRPVPFSDMTPLAGFPALPQKPCWISQTGHEIHERIRANLHRAPMYNGQIETTGPRYCPSIEDKVVRFADRSSHHVFLEPESLETNEIYCNGISTSLPADVQDFIVRNMPGCANAKILRHGYAVEYDMVWPHQIDATCMTKLVPGLFLAGQINGTSGYEEAAGQGLIAGLNAVRYARGHDMVRLRRDQAYLGVMMDDLVTKTPREPYRMFTSRAEFRLLLRADNTDERLTPLGRQWGLVDDPRQQAFEARQGARAAMREYLRTKSYEGMRLMDWCKRPHVDADWLAARINGDALPEAAHRRLLDTLIADIQYAGYIDRQDDQIRKLSEQESTPLPDGMDYKAVEGLRNEAKQTLSKFRPATLGQAARLAGITPADLMVVSVALRR